jgi:pyrimidine operon attenuation protein/uracil phosphoribosyltransferase
MKNKTLILNRQDIRQKIKRMSYEILENNYDEKELVFIGISNNGLLLARQITEYIKTISDVHITLASVDINKAKPLSGEIELNIKGDQLNNKVVILVDDVANSGKTLTYSMRPVLQYMPKKIQVAVLVDRKHKSFPVTPDYVGLSLSTTMKEHITVDMKQGAEAAYLT